jgi:hypothetical protein
MNGNVGADNVFLWKAGATLKRIVLMVIDMLFISTGIFDDKLRPQIVSVGTTANSPLSLYNVYINIIYSNLLSILATV